MFPTLFISKKKDQGLVRPTLCNILMNIFLKVLHELLYRDMMIRKSSIKTYFNLLLLTNKVGRSLEITSQGASECLFLSSSDLKSHFDRKLDLIQLIFD